MQMQIYISLAAVAVDNYLAALNQLEDVAKVRVVTAVDANVTDGDTAQLGCTAAQFIDMLDEVDAVLTTSPADALFYGRQRFNS